MNRIKRLEVMIARTNTYIERLNKRNAKLTEELERRKKQDAEKEAVLTGK